MKKIFKIKINVEIFCLVLIIILLTLSLIIIPILNEKKAKEINQELYNLEEAIFLYVELENNFTNEKIYKFEDEMEIMLYFLLDELDISVEDYIDYKEKYMENITI